MSAFDVIPDGNDFYLVNLSKETLDSVIVSTGGFTGGEDVAAIAGGGKYEYKNVKPNTAVKVEEYDYFHDPDFVLQVDLRIKSKSLGCIIVKNLSRKGSCKRGCYSMGYFRIWKKAYIELRLLLMNVMMPISKNLSKRW